MEMKIMLEMEPNLNLKEEESEVMALVYWN